MVELGIPWIPEDDEFWGAAPKDGRRDGVSPRPPRAEAAATITCSPVASNPAGTLTSDERGRDAPPPVEKVQDEVEATASVPLPLRPETVQPSVVGAADDLTEVLDVLGLPSEVAPVLARAVAVERRRRTGRARGFDPFQDMYEEWSAAAGPGVQDLTEVARFAVDLLAVT
jgi:hypothetical protein